MCNLGKQCIAYPGQKQNGRWPKEEFNKATKLKEKVNPDLNMCTSAFWMAKKCNLHVKSTVVGKNFVLLTCTLFQALAHLGRPVRTAGGCECYCDPDLPQGLLG